jgi:hypothetical protein
MAILDLVNASSARGTLLRSRRATPRELSPAIVVWMLRITTIVLLMVATLIGLQLAMDAPTVPPSITVIGQEPEADGHT